MTYIAVTFHFSYLDLMDMEHVERIDWVEQARLFNEEQKRQHDQAMAGVRARGRR